MKLHTNPDEFHELISIVAQEKNISESAVERDYYIVMMLKALSESAYSDQCVFKGGTSLSKCYPNSIERFSEDIDLTFLGMELSDNACDKAIKAIEKVMTAGANTEKIDSERSNRSKSMYVRFAAPEDRIKLEIGSTVHRLPERRDINDDPALPYSRAGFSLRRLERFILPLYSTFGFYSSVYPVWSYPTDSCQAAA